MSKSSVFLVAVLAAFCVLSLGHYYSISSSSDSDWYIKIAKGDIENVIKPFSGRVLHPLAVSSFSFITGLPIEPSFEALNVLLLFAFLFILSLFFSKISFMNKLFAFVVFVSPVLLNYSRYFFLAELFYGVLTLLFVYLLKERKFIWSLPVLFALFLTRPIQALILGLVLVVVSFYKSERKFALVALALVFVATFTSFSISSLGQPNAHNLDDARYYIIQPIYYFIKSVFGVELLANTHVLQYCTPKFSVQVPNWLPLGEIKSIGMCRVNLDRPMQTLLYPLITFGAIPLALFFAMRKRWRKIWEENEVWLLTALIYGVGILSIAILVPGLRAVGYGWPAFWLAGLFIIDSKIKAWPMEAKKKYIALFIAIHVALAWVPYLIMTNFFSSHETLKYSIALAVAFALYFFFVRMYSSMVKKYSIG